MGQCPHCKKELNIGDIWGKGPDIMEEFYPEEKAKPEPTEFATLFRQQLDENNNNYVQGKTILMGKEACDVIDRLTAEIKIKDKAFNKLKERYKDEERLWEISEPNECDGNCDINPPYKPCPECAAGRLLNELGEILGESLRNIEQALKGGEK